MKNLLIAAAVAVVAITSGCSPKPAVQVSESDTNNAIEAIMTRSSVRQYTERPISADTIDIILRAGMAAPTAVNKQPWAFVVIEDKALLKQIADSMPNAAMAAKAPLAIVVCGDMNKALEGTAREFWVQDCSAATENMLIAANALGLGGVWTGVYPNTDRAAAVSSMLSLPDNLIPLNIIPIGYPAGEPVIKDKWNPANIIRK